jgi:predicted nuclease with TOPRIM domain
MRQKLEDAIQELQEQMANQQDLDADDIQQLRAALNEIHQTLDSKDVNSATLGERFHEQMQSFQTSHPVLTDTAGRIADMLSQMGI